MAIFLVGLLALGGGWIWYLLIGKSLFEMRDSIATLNTELEKKNAEVFKEQTDIAKTLKVNPRLKDWRKLSLPETPKMTPEDLKNGISLDDVKKRHISHLQNEYEGYLDKLLRKSGFSSTMNLVARPPDSKASPPLSDKDKRPLYTVLAVNVKGHANLDAVVKALEEIHKAPLLQQVRSLTVKTAQVRGGTGGNQLGWTQPVSVAQGQPEQPFGRGGRGGGGFGGAGGSFPGGGFPGGGGAPGGGRGGRGGRGGAAGDLEVNMTVEAILVTGAEVRDTLMASDLTQKPQVLAPNREYLTALTGRNIFTGNSSASGRPTEDRDQVLSHVRLTMGVIKHDGDKEQRGATYWDQNSGLQEKKLTLTAPDFSIKDRYGTLLVEGKVVQIDSQYVIFKANERYYRWESGSYLSDAMIRPMRDEEVKSLGLDVAAAKGEENEGAEK
jgi:uncharacterized membrane protein YgcG